MLVVRQRGLQQSKTGTRTMTQTALQDFINTVTATNRITFGDVKRLNRSILPDGPVERGDVEALLALDAAVARSDQSFGDWLTQAVVDFAVWGERPTGTVEGEAAAWLIAALSRNGAMTRTAKRIAREIEREAELADTAIAALAEGAPEADEAGETIDDEDEASFALDAASMRPAEASEAAAVRAAA
jgi:hypothetical protein